MKKRAVPFAVFLALLFASRALSHDYWLEPENFFPARGSQARVRLHVGEHLKSEDERPLQKDRTVSFRLYSRGGVKDLLAAGQDGQKPVAQFTPESEGGYLLAMERKATTITLAPEQFVAYLREEGLEWVVAERVRAGEEQKVGRERYSRYVKALAQVGPRRDNTYRRVTGQRLEIIPQTNPYELKRGAPLRLRVNFDGKPLAGVRLFALNRAAGKDGTQQATTSADGGASFEINSPGVWAVRLVHMRRCASDCAEIDWESFWSSYTFGVK